MKCANAKLVSERMLSKLSFNDSGRPIFNTYSVCLPVTVRVVLTRNITTEVDNLVFVVIAERISARLITRDLFS